MTLEEIKARLTEREFSYYEALRAEDKLALDSFGEDGDLLRRSVEAKLEEGQGNKTKVRERELVIPEFNEDLSANDEADPADAKTDVLDSAKTDAPFAKGDILRGNRVWYKATHAIHRVKGVDRTTEPHTIKLEVFGKILCVSREDVRKVAPAEFDPRFFRRRKRRPQFAGTNAPRDHYGYDPGDD